MWPAHIPRATTRRRGGAVLTNTTEIGTAMLPLRSVTLPARADVSPSALAYVRAFVRTAGDAGQVAWRIPAASAAGIVRSGPGAGRDVREWETEMECASEPDGLAAGAGALPGARRRCEAGKRTHGPGTRACLALLAAAALLALAAPAQAQTEVWSATLTTVDLGFDLLGCSNGVPSGRCSSTTVLSEDSFTYDSTDYTITSLFTRSAGNLEIVVDADFTTNTLADLTLVVGSTSLVLSGGTASGTLKLIFSSPGITLTPGTDITVKLTAPGTPNTAAMGAPTITGTAQVDQTLTAVTTGITDADGLTSPTYTYQWIRVDGTDEEDISGENSSTYTLVDADLGKTLKVKVSFDDDASNTETLTSAATVTVVAAASTNTAPTGANKTVTTGEDRAYTFEADDFGFDDADATLASVTIVTVPSAGTLALDGTAVLADGVVTKAQIDGDMLTFTPARDAHGDAYTTFTFTVNDGTVDSASAYTMTIDVTDAPLPVCGVPSFGTRRNIWTGVVTVGTYTHLASTLYGYSSSAPAGALDDQTFTIGSNDYTIARARVELGGSNSGELVFETETGQHLTTVEVAALRLHVCDTVVYNFSDTTFSSGNSYAWTGTLDWSHPVVTRTVYLSLPANNVATGEPAITGTAQAGQELTADASPIMDTDGLTGVDFTYKWFRVDPDGTSNEAEISGETAATYTLTNDDVGKKIKVKVSFTDELSGEEERTSAAYPSSGTVTTVASTTAPALTSVTVTSTPRKTTDTYGAREHIEFSMTFDAAVTVTGAPTFAFDLGGASTATYYAGSGTTTLRFSHAVTGGSSGDQGTDGISWAANAIALNGGTIAGTENAVAAVLTHVAQSNLADHKVDGRTTPVTPATVTVAVTSTPMLMASGSTTADTYGFGETIVITVTVSEAVEVEGDPEFEFSLTVMNGPANDVPATYDRTRSTATTMVFTYTVQAGDRDNNGIWIGDHSRTFMLDANDRIRTASQQIDIDRSHPEKGTYDGHKVDGSLGAPTVPPDPTAPTLVSATATTLTVEWTHPGDGGSPLTRNFVHYRVEGTTDWTNWYAGETPVTRAVITNLAAATAYDVRVHSTNAIGNSQWVQSATAFSTLAGTASCPVPTFAGRRKIWTGVLTMGDFTEASILSLRGYDSNPESGDGGGLDPATFTLGSRDYEVGRIALVTSGASGLNFVVGQGQGFWWDSTVNALLLHVCNTSFDFSDSVYHYEDEDLGRIASNHLWTTDLDWSGVTTRTVHMSLPLNRPATGAPVITGPATVGQVLAVDVTGIEDEDGLHDVEYTYQWVRVDADGTSNEEDITDETDATYTLTDDDLGKKVKIEVSFPDDFGSDEQRTSAPTDTVTAVAMTTPGVTVSTTALTVNEEDTTGDSYTVVLNTQPTANVTVTVAGHAGTDVTPSPTSLTFTTTTWGTAQTVTVTAGDDADTANDAVTLTHSAASTDTGYEGISIDGVTVTVTDNDAVATAPTVNDVAVTSTPASGTTYYLAGEVIEFTVTFSAPVTVTATPKFAFRLGAATRQAAYASGSDSAALVFARTVQAGEVDRNGISWNAVALALDGGTITQTGATTAARLTHAEQAPLEGHRVDAAPPMQVSASVQGMSLVLVYDEPLDPASMPATGAYTVTATVGATTTNPAVSEVSIYGIWVTLTLDAAPAAGATVTLAYAPPASNPVQDEAGNDAPAFSGQSVRLGPPPPPPPDLAQVMGVGVAPGNAQLVVTWTAVDTATGYTVQWTSGGEDYNTGDRQAPVTSGSTTRYTIPSLINGTEYTVRVIATRTGATDGPPSAEETGTPTGEPVVPNNAPTVSSVSCDPCAVAPGGEVRLSAEASDPDGDSLTYAWSAPTGSFTGATDGAAARWRAPAETARVTVRVQVSDGRGGTASATATVEVTNAPPAFEQSSYGFELPEHEDGRRRPVALGAVQAEDPDGDAVTYSLASGDGERFAVGAHDGAVTYVGAGEDFEAEPNQYELSVRARDQHGADARVRVTVAVTNANEPPSAEDDEAGTAEDQRVVIDVLANDTDPDGDSLRVESVSAPAHGMARVASSGGVAYTPDADYHGMDRFTYVVADGHGETAAAAVEVTVAPVNDAPMAAGIIPDQRLYVGDEPGSLDLRPFFDDRDGDPLSYTAVASDTAVAVGLTDATLTLTVARPGAAMVTVTAQDPGGLTATQAFMVTMTDRQARGVIEDTLAALGRGHLASARATLGRRVETTGQEPSHVTVAGLHVPLGAGARGVAAAGQAVAERWITGLAGGMPLQTGGWAGTDAVGAPGSPAATLGMAGGAPFGAADPAQLGARATPALSGVSPVGGGGQTDFLLTLGSGQGGGGAAQGQRWTVWGQSDLQSFAGERSPTARYDGELWTTYVGVDARLSERWLAGVAVSRSRGNGDWTVGSSTGRLTTTLTSVQPYLRWSDGGTTIWATGGGGPGTARNALYGLQAESDLELRLGLVEVRRRLATVGGGVELQLRGDASWARLRTAEGDGLIDALAVEVRQLRVGIDVSRPVRTAGGTLVEPFGEVHARRDGGVGQTGVGLEVAGGLRVARGVFRVEGMGRLLALHAADGYRERGGAVTLSVGDGARQPGLTLSLSPRWGAQATASDALWQDQLFHQRTAGAPGARRDERALDARVDYGLQLPAGGLLTPFGIYGQSRYGRRLQVGLLLSRLGPVGLEVSGERAALRYPGRDEYRISALGSITFGGAGHASANLSARQEAHRPRARDHTPRHR